ncbi:MAG: hypothetical protein AAFQ58_19145 [Pseudomonadota bacterium]
MSVNLEAAPIRVEPKKMVKKLDSWQKAEAAAKQAAGARREAIGAFVEDAGLHKKAFAQFRALRKIEDDGKKRHAIRTLQALIPILEAEIEGADLGLDEPQDNVVKMQKAAETADAEMNELEADEGAFNQAADEAGDATDPINLAQPAE